MSHAELEAALHEVPFLAPIGVSVAGASAGRIVLRIPADKRTRDFEGHVASGAQFIVGELAATLALASHPAIAGRAVRRTHAEITYETTTTRPLLVTAEVRTLPDLAADEPEVSIWAHLMDRETLVATVMAQFVVPAAPS